MEKSTIALSLITLGLVGYVAYEHMVPENADSEPEPETLEAVGRSRRHRRATSNSKRCNNVKIGSPDFARCANELGAARNIIAGDPLNVAHNINTAFVHDEYTPQGASKKGKAFPFTDSSNSRDGRNESKDARLPPPNALMFKKKSGEANPFVAQGSALGAAVSPSAMGASKEEILQSTKRPVKTTVASNTGGNLNLLHPLE